MSVENVTIKDVQKKIKSVRSTYYLELRKVDQSKASGGGTDFIYKPSMPWFTDMDHIMKRVNLKEKEAFSNLESRDYVGAQDELSNKIFNEEEVENFGLEQPMCDKSFHNIQLHPKNKGQKRRLNVITDAVRELKGLQEKLDAYITVATTSEDECDIMGKHIDMHLRQLPTDERLRANFEFQRSLMDFRLRNLEQPPSTTTSNSIVATASSPYTSILDISNSYTPVTVGYDQSNLIINTDIITAAIANSDISVM